MSVLGEQIQKNTENKKCCRNIKNLKTLMDNMFVYIEVKLMDTTLLMNLLIFMIIDARQCERIKYGLDHWTFGLMNFFWGTIFEPFFGPFFNQFLDHFLNHFLGGSRPLVLW